MMKSKNKIILFAAVGLLSFTSLSGCGVGLPTSNSKSASSNPGADSHAMGDLYFTNGSQNLAVGIEASGTANQFVNCKDQLAFNFLPKMAKKWLVAFGASAPASCSNCVPHFKCTPGETITIMGSCLGYPCNGASAVANPSAYDSTSTAGYGNTIDTCPGSGVYTAAPQNSIGNQIKLTYSSDSGSDTEYLTCD